MTRKQMLNTWGYLRALANLYQQRQDKLIERDNELSLQTALDYDRQITEINYLLHSIWNTSTTAAIRAPKSDIILSPPL